MITRALAPVLVSLCVVLFAAAASAQSLTAADAGELQALLERAREAGARVVVIEVAPGVLGADPENVAGQPGEMAQIQARALAARAELGAILAESPEFFGRVFDKIQSHDPAGALSWPLVAAAWVAVFLLVGLGAERLFHLWGRPHFQYLFNSQPRNDAEKIAYLLLRGFMQFVGLAIQIGVALLILLALDTGQQHVRATGLTVIAAVGFLRALTIFFGNLLAVDTPSHRLLNLSDAEAKRFHGSLLAVLAITTVTAGLCEWMDALGLNRNAHLLSLLGSTFLSTVLLVVLVGSQRRAVANMILGFGPREEKGLFLRFVASTWHIMATVYLVLAWTATATRLVLDLPNALGLVVMPILIVFGALTLNALTLLAIEWIFTARKMPADKLAGERPGGHGESIAPELEGSADQEAEPTGVGGSFKALFQHAAGMLIVIFALWMILDLWGAGLAAKGSSFHGLTQILIIIALSYLGFQAVKITIDRKIEAEGGIEEPEPGEEGGASAASRVATLLPLLRNFLLIVISVISGMVVLSEMGVDIAPLFAGAGVIGLAIGFGAQTLIRDIFSGAFFLMDDAFRKGEYIDIGSVKGNVEKISIRSMQLRHHKGPLHTVPFGEILHLTNYSRDWVMMKLPLRVTYDTDVEKVRKLIKNLGQELLEDPEIGGDFLQPLKSQGVYQMEDSAMIIRVKFMTRPGDQFVARKMVYSKIRELFEKEGIKFAHREVTVRIADTPGGRALTEEQKEAVAGAVQPLIEEVQQAAGPATDR